MRHPGFLLPENQCSTTNLDWSKFWNSVDPRNVTSMFGYPDEIPLDVLKQMNYELVCRNNATEYIVQVCDSTNPTREFGDVKMVAPVGDF
ncbi:hypothetical protein B9Z55_011065 [Caenorhabditis nigoni]|uniref:Uncharacterized protein n=1 Tax=Caenorhabditis nigoni TaxID=1611254 RepID=A0A2G5UIF8_9PELO|nr:hypothetical protein B9Z55_011065 [Caenorhabditis nigoni]